MVRALKERLVEEANNEPEGLLQLTPTSKHEALSLSLLKSKTAINLLAVSIVEKIGSDQAI